MAVGVAVAVAVGVAVAVRVGVATATGAAARQAVASMVLEISVTEPVRANNRPDTVAVSEVMLACARMLPAKIAPVSRVAELPT